MIRISGWVQLGGRQSACRKDHALGRFNRMCVPEMAVGLGDKKPAVAMPQPTGADLEVHARFDGVAAKIVSQ